VEAPPFGLGFRPRYFGDLVESRPPVDWLELVSENFMGIGGRTRRMLERLRADYPIALHGVSLSIAGTGPLEAAYLSLLGALVEAVQPVAVGDHLSWTSWRGRESHDLLPVAYTRAVLDHVAARVLRVQDHLRRRLVIENPTVYVAFADDEMEEADFLAELCARTSCAVLLDVNNLYVNALNLGRDPERYLTRLQPESIAYFHIAGHAVLPDVRIDTHDEPVPDPVWALYRRACARFPQAGTILERDAKFPAFADLLAELGRARAVRNDRDGDRNGDRPQLGPVPIPRPSGSDWPALQSQFFAYVSGETPSAALPLRDAPGAVKAQRGLDLYREAFTARLARGLGENFPALARVLGRRAFEALIAAYISAHPPRGYAFNAIGAALARFIPTHACSEDFGVPVAVLAELAALEQAELEVADEPDDGAALAPSALAEVAAEDWPGARLRCTRAVRLLTCAYDVLPVVEAVAAGREPARPTAGVCGVLIARPHADVIRRRLAPDEAGVIGRLLAGDRMEEACAEAGEAIGARAVALLVTLGLVRAIEI
jgi:uncharacterized protein (UPF0276 family)